MIIMITVPGRGQLGEDPAQRRLTEPAYGARGEAQSVLATGQVTLLLEFSFEIAQRGEVADRPGSQSALEHLDIDVVQRRTGIGLGELRLQRFEIGDLGHRLDGFAVAEGLPARTHPGVGLPVQSRTQRAQVVRELSHLRGQVGVGQRLAHQLTQLLALLRAQRGQHSLGRGLAAGQRVDEFVDRLRLLGKELAVAGHEVGELVGRVLLPGVRREQRVQIGQHVLDPLHRLGVRRVEGLLHAGELGVQHLAAQHVLDRLEGRPGLIRAPLVVVQRAHGAGDVVGQRVQFQLGEPRVVAVGAGQGLPLGGQRLVQCRPDLIQGAAEIAAPAGLRAQLPDLVGQPVQTAAAVQAHGASDRAEHPAGCRPT